MDFTELSNYVLRRFQEAGGYSDIGDEEFVESVKEFLEGAYKKAMVELVTLITSNCDKGSDMEAKTYKIGRDKVRTSMHLVADMLCDNTKESLSI